MVEIGKRNYLRISRTVDFGAYLDGDELGEILIPKRYLPERVQIDDSLEVFVYNDSEDRLVAVTDFPIAQVGDFAWLNVKSVNSFGAFLEWGLPKDLLVPFREQNKKLIEGKQYLVYIFLDLMTRRIVASTKLDKFLDNVPPEYSQGEEVNIIVSNETDLGFKVIVNSCHWGILYKNLLFKKIEPGQKLTAYVLKVREDEKIDVTLQKPGLSDIIELTDIILNELKNHNGFLPLTDKTDPEEIYMRFGVSKKNFKKALGDLYKRKKISIENDGIKIIL
jgi:predicted RNA-binding protein (virulence factor B family)